MNPPFGARSVRGRFRDRNEDRLIISPGLGLFALSDGMGGLGDGGAAADLIAAELPELVARCAPPGGRLDTATGHRIATALEQLSVAVREMDRRDQPAGATVVLGLTRGDRVVVVHIGDSRAYLLHGDGLDRLTQDHSIAGELVRRGRLTEQEEGRHPGTGMLTRYLGMPGTVRADVVLRELSRGDRLMLCTDGLAGSVSDRRIRAVLRSRGNPETAVLDLVEEARNGVTGDDTSVIVIDRGDG